MAALNQIAMSITTKGGQQALEGVKQQLGTTVGPSSALWDTNPPAVAGSTFASGPGTKLEVLKARGAGQSPEDARQYKLMACMVAGVPETFLGDVSTGNLATATSLDRPTETVFLEKQESWREDLITICTFVLQVSRRAPAGKLRESHRSEVVIRECGRKTLENGRRVYEAFTKRTGVIEVKADFPAIREGDIPSLVDATLKAMAIDRLGQEHGLDPKTAVRQFAVLLNIPDPDELAETLYPEATYEHDRTKAQQLATQPVALSSVPPKTPPPAQQAARIREALRRINVALEVRENGHAQHTHTRG